VLQTIGINGISKVAVKFANHWNTGSVKLSVNGTVVQTLSPGTISTYIGTINTTVPVIAIGEYDISVAGIYHIFVQ
jgi:hypothetical protein